jgi:uncharacterized protein YggE
MASVIVRGTAAASVSPDRAELTLEVSHVASDAAGALANVAERSQQLVAMLASHGIARTDWATEGVHVGEEHEWKNNRHVLVGYRASTAVSVTIRDLDKVGVLINEGVTTAKASVRNLMWHVDRENPTHNTLMAAAARDAKARAFAYTEALGLRLGEVELISETPIAASPEPGPRFALAMADSMAMAAPPEVAVSGGLIELNASVHVRFAVLN